MSASAQLDDRITSILQCPVCHATLNYQSVSFRCSSSNCQHEFPIVTGVPVIINESNSAFAIDEFRQGGATTFRHQPLLERFFTKWIPEITANYRAEANYRQFLKRLLKKNPKPLVLVIGCGEVGEGMQSIIDHPDVTLVNTDVYFGTRTAMICDSHDLPFQDRVFDGVIIQAVLEHVADPPRCVHELHRVLSDDSLVYAETPFMQQVHGGPFDFTRYTCLGHRRLFRYFDEIESGATAGSALALAWAYQYFLLSLVRGPRARVAMKGIARLTSCWLRLVDRWIVDRPASLDASLGHYFLGSKRDTPIPDHEIVKLYRGGGYILPDPASNVR